MRQGVACSLYSGAARAARGRLVPRQGHGMPCLAGLWNAPRRRARRQAAKVVGEAVADRQIGRDPPGGLRGDAPVMACPSRFHWPDEP